MPPRKTGDPNVMVRNNLTPPKVTKRPFNPRDGNQQQDRPGMVYTGILTGILLMIVLFFVFLVAHYETNRYLKEMTQNLDKSRKGK